jgi:5-methylcytosine-specific restriction endonuclease McrA
MFLFKEETKKCCRCKEILPVSYFYLRNSKKFSYPSMKYSALCKKCDKIRLLKDKDRLNLLRKEKRHKNGISKSYGSGPKGPRLTKEEKEIRKKLSRKICKYNRAKAGKLTKKIIQLVYEDNIKKYGTLTCYLCLKPIDMQKEHLEHKNPLSKGGTNDYENLGIACSRCNCRKHNMTVTQYFEYLNKMEKK